MKRLLFIFGLLFVLGCQPISEQPQVPTDFIPDKVIDIRAFNFGFEPNEITVNEGEKIRLVVENTQNIRHTFTLPEFGIDEKLGSSQTVTIDFIADKSGTFEFFCTVLGHRPAGMEGSLEVN